MSAAWVAAAVTGAGPMIGISAGALLSGALAQHANTLSGGYGALAAVLGLCAMALWLSPETMARAPGALASLRPQVRIPPAARRLLPVAAAVAVPTWALGGYYQAFSPILAADQLGTTNTLLTAAIFASYLAPGTLAGPLGARVTPATAQRVGMTGFTLGVAALLFALYDGSIGLFLGASVFAGAAQALAFTGGIRGLLPAAAPADRAGLLSAVFLISYTGAAVPGLIAGRLTTTFTLGQITLGYGALALLGALITLLGARNPAPAAGDIRSPPRRLPAPTRTKDSPQRR